MCGTIGGNGAGAPHGLQTRWPRLKNGEEVRFPLPPYSQKVREYTIAIAGHVDHGKSALVKSLTGINTNVLKEEKERGLTIVPGIAPLFLSEDLIISFIDLPGHEDFIKNMVRGASTVDGAILVVAADDGVMPQTKEHLDILNLLGIRHGFVVLSKIDLVDEETQFMAKEEIKELIKGTPLENAPIIPFSAITSQGKEKIIECLHGLVRQITPKTKEGYFRLPIDRVLTIPGYGTVVTGTILSGECHVGEVVSLYPTGRLLKIKGLQVHHRPVERAIAGQRVGINLYGKGPHLERGMVLAENGLLMASCFINALFLYTPPVKEPLLNHTFVRLYLGTMETTAVMVFMDRQEINPGDNAFVQFRCRKPLSALPQDRLVVRSLSPAYTIGGGMVVEVTKYKYRKRMHFLIEHYKQFCRGINKEFVEELIEKSQETPITIKEIFKKTGLLLPKLQGYINCLLREGKIFSIGQGFYHVKNITSLQRKIISYLEGFHKEHRLKIGPAKEEVHQQLCPKVSTAIFEKALDCLIREKKIRTIKGCVQIMGFSHKLNSSENALYQKIKDYAINQGLNGFTLVSLKEAFFEKDQYLLKRVLDFMLKEGEIVRLNIRKGSDNERFLHKINLEKAWDKIRAYLLRHGKIDIQEAKSVLSLSRRPTVAILDYLDTMRLTLRVNVKGDDYRILLHREGASYNK